MGRLTLYASAACIPMPLEGGKPALRPLKQPVRDRAEADFHRSIPMPSQTHERGCPQPQQHRPRNTTELFGDPAPSRTCCGWGQPRSGHVTKAKNGSGVKVRTPAPGPPRTRARVWLGSLNFARDLSYGSRSRGADSARMADRKRGSTLAKSPTKRRHFYGVPMEILWSNTRTTGYQRAHNPPARRLEHASPAPGNGGLCQGVAGARCPGHRHG